MPPVSTLDHMYQPTVQDTPRDGLTEAQATQTKTHNPEIEPDDATTLDPDPITDTAAEQPITEATEAEDNT